MDILALILFFIPLSFSPGPNNLMVLASGVNFGFKKTIPHVLGISFGFILKKYLLNPLYNKLFNISMALLLVGSFVFSLI